MKKTLFCSAALVSLALLGAGCSSAEVTTTSVQQTPSTPPPSSVPATTTPPTPPVVSFLTKNVSDADTKSTVNVKVGDHIQIVLHSTYWQFPATASNMFKQLSEPSYAPLLGGHVPGSGAGTVTVEYVVTQTGTGTLTASRTSCGEAMRCTGDQGSFSLKVTATK